LKPCLIFSNYPRIDRGYNAKGIFDRNDLLDLLIDRKAKIADVTSYISLEQLSFGDKNSYIGLTIQISKEKLLFMVDTGATMNLIKREVSSRLGLAASAQQTYTVGSGGLGPIGSSTVAVENGIIGSIQLSFTAAVLENSNMIPSTASGLLGLGFLQSLATRFGPKTLLKFDFNSMRLQLGSRESLLTPLIQLNSFCVKSRRIYAGLLVVDVYIGNDQSGKSIQVSNLKIL